MPQDDLQSSTTRRSILGGFAVAALPATASLAGSGVPGPSGDIVTPQMFGAKADRVTDDTAAIAAALRASPSVRFPPGIYAVTQVTFAGLGLNIDMNGAQLMGIATSDTNAVLQITCGHSTLRGLKVNAHFNPHYAAAVHWYTNDLNRSYPGRNQIDGLYVTEARIGLAIGALPSQRGAIPAQGAVAATGLATNAPLSESEIRGFQSYACVRALTMRQPNGKITMLGPTLSGETGDWPGGYPAQAECSALMLADDGSELSIIGGTIINGQVPEGTLFTVTGGNLHIQGAALETVAPSYQSGNSIVRLDKIMNFGFNYPGAPFTVDKDTKGSFTISDTRMVRGAQYAVAGGQPLIRSVDGLRGGFAPNPNFVVDCDQVEFRDARFTGTGSYVPLVHGVRIRNRQGKLTSFDSTGATRVLLKHIDDGQNLLAGAADLSFATVPAFSQTGNRTEGGWTFAASSGTSLWGRDAAVPALEDMVLNASLRCRAGGSAATISARTGKFPFTPGRTYLVKGWIRTGPSSAAVRLRITPYRFDDTPIAPIDFIAGPQSMFGPAWQPLLGWFTAPKDATKGEFLAYAENGAEMYLAGLEIV